MASSNFFDDDKDDDKTVYGDFEHMLEETKLLFFMESDPENKLFLTSGTSVTIGRNIESDFFIENKTVSRKHLTLTRDGEQVKIQIYGRNGLSIGNQLHTGSAITLCPPTVFKIGDVSCCIDFETDEDKTIILTSNHRSEIPPPHLSEEQFYKEPIPSIPQTKPFAPSPKDTFISSPAPVEPSNMDFSQQEGPVTDRQNSIVPPVNPIQKEAIQPAPTPSETFDPIPQKSAAGFDSLPNKDQGVSGQLQGRPLKNNGGTNRFLIAGIVALPIVIIALAGFLFFSGKSDQKNAAPDSSMHAAEKQMVQPSPAATVETKQEDPDQTRIIMAEILKKSGDKIGARDILKDIPKESPYYGKAQRLMETLPEN